MTHTIGLPALDGRDPLGFLAALGTLRILTDHAHLDAELSFNDTTATATLHSPLATIDDVVGQLVEIIESIPSSGVIPGVTTAFPLAKTGTQKDPMRSPRPQFRTAAASITDNDPHRSRWLTALVTDLATDNDGRVALTPYTAPAGQQSLRSLFTKPLEHIRIDPDLRIREALTSWRRIDGYTGESLDHRAIRTAADHPTGESVPAGVPGATWLAIMALPLLRLTGTGTNPQATCWHRLPGTNRPLMTWPLWRQPLDPHAITALLEHPDLRPTGTAHQPTFSRQTWPALGVFTITCATRTPSKKSAGVLAPMATELVG